jgi:hypothetical protein
MALAGMNVHPTRAIVILKNRKRCIFLPADSLAQQYFKTRRAGIYARLCFGLHLGLAGMNARPTHLYFNNN